MGTRLRDGDLAVIRPGVRVLSGQTLTLAAANPAYAVMVIRNQERRRVTIVGRRVGVVRGWIPVQDVVDEWLYSG